MISCEYDQEDANTLRDFELLLKELNRRYPERELSKPHSLEEQKDILTLALPKGDKNYAHIFHKQQLIEANFFNSSSDVEVYQHMRYLPANWHTHDFIEIAYVVQGHCTNYILEQQLEMEQGDIFIIAPGTKHAISAFTDDCLLFNILLRTSTFDKAFFGVLNDNDILSDFFMHTLYHSSGHPYLFFRTGKDMELINYIGQVRHEFRRNRQYKNRMLISILNIFFITLLRNHGAHVILPDSSGNNHENTILILKYLQEHYNTITLPELASFFNYSERQLQRIIKNSTGISFSENIQKLKLHQAARLLQNPNRSISSIGEELGYSDPGNFRQMFKKYYNMTPTEYRNTKVEVPHGAP
ncbi:AraC family transcriptional regulator [Lachnospiraceae bacterium OttesenSCG-928-D06]|nr:AraC family transcriptional regulator [Lachnospiraceae bacterium OttesenSCG-928-D06]